MTYTLRNTIILLIMFAVVAFVGEFTTSFGIKKDAELVENILKKKQAELEKLREGNQYYEDIENEMIAVKNTWITYPKSMHDEENSVVSYAYLNTLASQSDSRINFNFRKNNTKSTGDGKIRINSYTLKGNALFRNLFRFLWKVENYAPLYDITELEISSLNAASSDKTSANRANFLLTIKGYSVDQGDLEHPAPKKESQPERLTANPFYALIQKNLAPNVEGLLNLKQAKLIGLSETSAYIRDSQGKIWDIKKGEKVYQGKLSKIEPDANVVEFTINEGGFWKKVTLSMDFDKK